MATSVIEDERVRWRRDVDPTGGELVVYWMQQAQRVRHNPALEYAVQQANRLELPLAVVFCVVNDCPDASARHYRFMLEGLADVEGHLRARNIAFQAIAGQPESVIGDLADVAAMLVFDRGYLPIQRRWRDSVEEVFPGPIVEVETDVVVPIELVSNKLETAARTIRPKLKEHIDRFVVELRTTALDDRLGDDDFPPTGSLQRIDLRHLDEALDGLGVAAEPGPVEHWQGGTNAATRILDRFITDVLPDYQAMRNRYDVEPSSSQLSPYLHLGHISRVEVVRRVRASSAAADEVDAFVEELIVRRELAINYVTHEPAHDRFAGLPEWAKTTLRDHQDDDREVVLTAAELETGETPDDVWNAIMALIREQGWVHNQLRMYWGKQVLRWTNTPGHAFRTLLDLNNRYCLDGRDANSYANVAWCFGRHDQGFQERDVIGKIRPFTTSALERKGDLQAWLESVESGD